MYWLVSILVITVMMAILGVADDVDLPANSLLDKLLIDSLSIISLPKAFTWIFLIFVTAVLLFLLQRNAFLSDVSHCHRQNNPSAPKTFIVRFFRYLPSRLFTMAIASLVVIGSALQALSAHQQAASTAITEPMRVQAWVTIEGISDSVYDPASNSGYRQVATIQALTPLVSELTRQDLNAQTLDYLSKNSLNSSDKETDKTYRVLLNAYPQQHSSHDKELQALNDLAPNDKLLMTLKLMPLATSQTAVNNPSGFDSYQWLRSRHIDGVATVIATGVPVAHVYQDSTLTPATTAAIPAFGSGSTSYLRRIRISIDQWRWQLRQHFYQDWSSQTTSQQQATAVTLSLLTGDRSLISRDTKDLYQLAGISHLLAISGTHVLFLAIMLAGAAVVLFDRLWPALYRLLPRWQVRWWVMMSAAFIYALFTGFDVPAARTAWMLLAIGLMRLTLLPISTMRILLALAVIMAWMDPYVLWQAGYWLSFIAVALLLKYDDSAYKQASGQSIKGQSAPLSLSQQSYTNRVIVNKVGVIAKRLVKLQFWLFIALLPMTLLLFGKASLWGLVINLFAIGLFGWVIVPLNLLAGLCYLLLPSVADGLWGLVTKIVTGLHELIAWLTSVPALSEAWLYTPVNMAMIIMALMAMSPWLLPRGLVSRWLVLPPLALLMMTVYANQQSFYKAPTLYMLPTGDAYISAALLQYPVGDSQSGTVDRQQATADNVSWLFLADHRRQDKPTRASTLTAQNLSATLEQQLRTLSIKRIEGIVVQTSALSLTDTFAKPPQKTAAPELLPMVVLQLSQSLPTKQYWQAGRHERWSSYLQLYSDSHPSTIKATISAQRCDQGKLWQLPNGDLALQAVTGWSEVEDRSVWDCSIAIHSEQPIEVVKYNAANPQQPLLPNTQQLIAPPILHSQSSVQPKVQPSEQWQTRLMLDTATHQRVWQLWSLLCPAESLDTERPIMGNHASAVSKRSTQWLAHSASQVSADILSHQHTTKVMSYDDKDLAVALSLSSAP